MTVSEMQAAIDVQIAQAEATLRDVLWTAEGVRSTLIELKVQKSTLELMTAIKPRPREVPVA